LLRNLNDVSGTLAGGREDLGDILRRASVVLETLAQRRQTIHTLLAATNDLTVNLAELIQTARRPIEAGTTDLTGLMIVLQEELDTIELAIEELPVAQSMFARPLAFGRFIETHICAVTTEDTCVPEGTPRNPGLPSKGTQPEGATASVVKAP
jgi:phospholipid/cholesterol/gamma-HCH transport system substrate-binding protein